MKRLKLILVMLLAVLGILLCSPARSSGEEKGSAVKGHFINEAILECCSTYVDSPDTGPHGDMPVLYVGDTVEGDDGRCRGFLRFELPTLPANSTILGAQLCLYSQESQPPGRKRTIGVHKVMPPELVWDEATVTWNNPPGFGDAYEPAPTDSITSNFWPGWAYWDVTIDVSEVYGMGFNSYSAAVVMEGEPDYMWNSFYTKEQPPEPSYAPRLVITYAPGGMFVPSGSDCYITESAEIRFGPLSGSPLPKIPADFFGPGSDPFDGGVYLRSQPFDSNSGVDTKINRTKDVFLLDSDPCQVPIELIELNLVSTTPITVTGNGIDFPAESFFDVYVQPLIVPAPGQMTVIKEHDTSGGTFQYDTISLSLVFDFVYAGPESEPPPSVYPTAQLEVYDLSIGTTGLHGWRNLPDKHPPCGYDGFYPSGEGVLDAELMYLAVLPTGHLSWSPPRPVMPQFALITGEDWLQAVGEERVRPMSQEDGDDYIEQFNNNIGEGDEYPEDAEFLPSDLYVWEDPNGDDEPNDAGLMMTWGDPCATAGEPGHMEDGNDYASAWEYVYPGDPDLSNCIITVMIEPPCGIRVVSLGLKDINGNIRGWYWNVSPNAGPPPPGMIQCSPGPGRGGTKITIDLTQTGTAAATPTANSYSNNPNFDITKVAQISFDEDNVYVASTQVPVPGSGIKASWNYWYNLIVATKTPPVAVTSKYYPKWSQRPTVIDPNQPNLLLGWNEYSNYYWRPIVADDWQCTDKRPITDIHWWGSFFWWTQPYPPPVMPQAFHIGIWTDVAAGDPANLFPFSHPGYLIWENFCSSYVWNYAGYDTFPGLDPTVPMETCFQFNQLLSEDEWFYQDPNAPWDMDGDPDSTVYWLSIAAIYDPTQPAPIHPWGWKTRKPHWNDDAVAMFDCSILYDWPWATPPPTWPPTIGSMWTAGTPVEYPLGTSWDMTFELTTNEPDPNQSESPDLNRDGIVNLKDLAIMADKWLTSGL